MLHCKYESEKNYLKAVKLLLGWWWRIIRHAETPAQFNLVIKQLNKISQKAIKMKYYLYSLSIALLWKRMQTDANRINAPNSISNRWKRRLTSLLPSFL